MKALLSPAVGDWSSQQCPHWNFTNIHMFSLKKASCLNMSRVEFDQFSRMCQESWEQRPRLTRMVRAATDYWTKLQLRVLFSLSAIKYFIITQWARECKWGNWQLRVKAWFQSWLWKSIYPWRQTSMQGGVVKEREREPPHSPQLAEVGPKPFHAALQLWAHFLLAIANSNRTV